MMDSLEKGGFGIEPSVDFQVGEEDCGAQGLNTKRGAGKLMTCSVTSKRTAESGPVRIWLLREKH